jgi:hypothetical protein
LENLNESYGHILNENMLPPELDKMPDCAVLQDVVITSDKDIRHLIDWNTSVMNYTLGFAKRCLGLHKDSNLTFENSPPNGPHCTKLRNVSISPHVDHVIGLDCLDEPVLVVGLGRSSSKWRCMKLLAQVKEPTIEATLPLRQLANICEMAGTRYGYIQTDEELVACLFSYGDMSEDEARERREKTRKREDRSKMKVSVRPIPWTKHGGEMLTTELALWWLCMLAMAPDHGRNITMGADVVGVDAWDIVHLDEERGWVRQHRYSKFEEPTNRPPPPSYRSPSLGNPAAFFAAVGLHADAEFGPDVNNTASFVDMTNLSTWGDYDDAMLLSNPDFLNHDAL